MKRFKGQQGFMSIFAVLIIMSVLTLVAIGFSTITRQSERRTLDNQLNTQAFYAAESAINDAQKVLSSNQTYMKTDCKTTGDGFNYSLDTTTGTGYSCLLVDTKPKSYEYTSVPVQGSAEPIVVPVKTTAVIRSFAFSWDSTTGSDIPAASSSFGMSNNSPYGGTPIFPTVATWGSRVGVLRVDLVPTDSRSRQDMIDHSFTFFLYPIQSGGVTSIGVGNGAANKAGTMLTTCNNAAPYRCKGTLNLFTNYTPGTIPTATEYVLRMQAFYNPVSVKVESLDSLGNTLEMQKGQAVIDATGQANDVFKRIRVRVPLTPNIGSHPAFALLTADSICKRMLAYDSGVDVDTGGITGSTDACQIGL